MGILNVTPDSFFDGDKFTNETSWLRQTEKMLLEGAAIIDIGCVSTRPGALVPNQDEELHRLLPVLNSITQRFPEIIISVDTFRSKVARHSINNGASIINDISGGTMDANMFTTIAELRVPYILMHIKGTPATMQLNPQYKDVAKETITYLAEKSHQLNLLGINDIIIDPGFGFGKTIELNFELLTNLRYYQFLPYPLLIGISRKSTIWKTLRTTSEYALNGTSVMNTISLLAGAAILRVHDVKEAKECIKLTSELNLNQN
ncbi:MAG: dihydropteroate synthase [Bacteroidota bacterium]